MNELPDLLVVAHSFAHFTGPHQATAGWAAVEARNASKTVSLFSSGHLRNCHHGSSTHKLDGILRVLLRSSNLIVDPESEHTRKRRETRTRIAEGWEL